jgi:hypothetical protein
MSRRRLTPVVAACVATLAACSVLGSSAGPLEQTTSEVATIGLNSDAGRVQDINASVELANPTDHSIRLLAVESLPDPRSPTQVEVVLFRLAGPDRRLSLSGGIITAEDLGAPLLPPSRAVIPAGAGKDDYILMVRYSVPRDVTWARNRGLRITYSTDGHTYTAVWRRQVTVCSPRAMGGRFCRHLI